MAQESGSSDVAVTDMEVMLQALETTTPLPASQAPEVTHGFYSVQNPGWPPLPDDVLGLSIWPLGDGFFALDDRNVDYAAIQAAADAASISGSKKTSLMARSFASSYAYGNPVYLTNMAAIPDGYGNMVASFSIAGGTNFVPCDILMSTNVAVPVANWNWLGIGYASNHYTFYGQPADLGFYILAKPSKTMIVAWGEDYYGQCDVPPGITNAVQVAGGGGYSIALLNDGTVVGWGNRTTEGIVPTSQTGVAMIASGLNHKVAMLTNGTVLAWGDNLFGECNVPANLTNATVISAQSLHTMALRSDGTVSSWGDINNTVGINTIPAGLSNVVAMAAGGEFNLAVTANGSVVAWGGNSGGECSVPAGLSNVVDVAAGWNHSVALKNDGTVVCWGDNTYGESAVPGGLTNVAAIAAGGYVNYCGYTIAVKTDGSVVTWGRNKIKNPIGGLTDVVAIGGEYDSGLAIRTGPPTPVITLEPADQYQIAGGNVIFSARGAGLYGVAYQWQTDGVNLPGATNAALTLTNVQTAQTGSYNVVVTDNGGMGSIVSSNANLFLVTPPVITAQTPLPTNQVCIYGNYVSFGVTATSPYQASGFPLTYQWRFNGTNISGAAAGSYNLYANDTSAGIYSVVVANAAGSTNASWRLTVTNAIDVTKDLLLVYNTNSADSTTVLNYYLAHRPMVSGANVLGIGCTTAETITPSEFTNSFVPQVKNWLANNPAVRPQYVILFLDIPSRVNTNTSPGELPPNPQPSVQYQISTGFNPVWRPFVTSINLNGTNDCIGYINKLAAFGTNGQVIISASASGYGNTNFVLDNVRHGPGAGEFDYSSSGYLVTNAIPAITNASSSAGVTYLDGIETSNTLFLPHITSAVNVAGYICWGFHSNWGTNFYDGSYAIDGQAQWSGNSTWWIIRTEESYNGQRSTGQGNFLKWFSPNAFGGTNYSNTPIGAVSSTEEPGAGATDNSIYFSLWASGKNFGICAWNSKNTSYLQVVGDPFVNK